MRPSLGACCLLLLACEGDVIRLGGGQSSDRPRGDEPPVFGEPVVIAALNAGAAGDDDPSLTADLTELLFNSERGGLGKEDIWSSQRASADAAWEAPQHVLALNTEARETGIALSGDGLFVLFSSDREGGLGGLDVYIATRSSRADGWSAPAHLAAISGAGDDLVSSLSADGLTLYLARREDDEDDYDLYATKRRSLDEPFGPAAPLTKLNSAREESDAFLWSDSTLFFTRDEELQRVQLTANGELELPARLVAALNSDDDDRDLWVAPNGRYAVFSSNRDGEYRLYEALAP